MSKVNARIAALMDELSKKRGETITVERLALETNLASGTVRKWVKGQVDRFDSGTLVTFIDYFAGQLDRSITFNDILEYNKN